MADQHQPKAKGIEDLRAALFDTLQGLKAGTVSVETARGINEIGKTLVDTAKVEIDYLRLTEREESEFLSSPGVGNNMPTGITGIVRHRLQG